MAIQQHPIPQDISNYKFRLIGDMTIRQFASLGIFIILSIVIYGSPIPFFFRYPLSFIFLVTGIAMAFIPIQGRSLDVWIIAFIKSIYAPTQYVWKSTPEESAATPTNNQELITNNSPITPIIPLSTPMSSSNDTNTTSVTVAPVKGRDGEAERGLEPTITPLQINQPAPIQTPTLTPENNTPEQANIPALRTSNLAPRTDIQIPPIEPIKIEPKTETPQEVAPVKGRDGEAERGSITPTPLSTNQEPITNNSPIAPPSISLPIPFTPTTPNTIVGLSLTPDNHILDGVMIEIKKDNLTVRATRSNKLGQFLFARPLENGIYQILAEKDGSTFTPYALELTGEIIRPLKIQAV